MDTALPTSPRPSLGLPALACLLAAVVGCADPAPSPAPAPSADTAPSPAPAPSPAATGLYALQATGLDGAPAPLAAYAGRVTLVVNVASECGFTPQYAGLQTLAEEFADRGLVVLGFPCNEFGSQEPGSPEQIAHFCSERFGVTFPLFEKCVVTDRPEQSPVYALLQAQTGEVPRWNFCKYLVGRDGRAIAFFPSPVAPDSEALRSALLAALD